MLLCYSLIVAILLTTIITQMKCMESSIKVGRLKREPPLVVYRPPPPKFYIPRRKPKPIYRPSKPYSIAKSKYGMPLRPMYGASPTALGLRTFSPPLPQIYGSPPPGPSYASLSQMYGPPTQIYGSPSTSYQPPNASYGPPSNIYGSHQLNNEIPSPTYGSPAPIYGSPTSAPPAPTYGLPSQTYGPPSPAYGPPSPAYGPPSPAYGPPTLAYGPPAPTYGPPASTYGPQTATYSPPPSSTYGPAMMYGAPITQYSTPSLDSEMQHVNFGPPATNYGLPAPSYGISSETSYDSQFASKYGILSKLSEPPSYYEPSIPFHPSSDVISLEGDTSFPKSKLTTYKQSVTNNYDVPSFENMSPYYDNSPSVSYNTPGAVSSYGTPVMSDSNHYKPSKRIVESNNFKFDESITFDPEIFSLASLTNYSYALPELDNKTSIINTLQVDKKVKTRKKNSDRPSNHNFEGTGVQGNLPNISQFKKTLIRDYVKKGMK